MTNSAVRRVAVLIAIAFTAASCGTASDTLTSAPAVTEAIVTSTVATTTLPPTTHEEAPTTTASPPTSTTVAATQVPRDSIWTIPAGLEVAVAGDDGLHLLTGGDDRIISPDIFDDVVADPAGDGWLAVSHLDFEDRSTPVKIHHIGDDSTDKVVLTADSGTYLQLHDTGMVDGHATIFYNVNLIRDTPNVEVADELYMLDLVTAKRSKLADIGGWENGVNLTFGGGILAGIWGGEATVAPWSVDLDGNLDVLDVGRVGLKDEYNDDPEGPIALAISPDRSRVTWITHAASQTFSQHMSSSSIDGSDRREFTLPDGPSVGYGLADRGNYLIAGAGIGPSTLIDIETGGLLVLPIVGPAAATGQWTQPPQWAIPSPVTEDATEQIRALEPQWTASETSFEQALADVLAARDAGEGECASQARGFPSTGFGGNTFYVELRQFCDDSVAGSLYEVTIGDPQPDGSITTGATRRTLCGRGATPDGLCI